jgi:LmbE family N-acetylglucosaminyl deacetylase
MLGDEFLSRQRLLVVTPHADDETYGCAGTIARVKALGGEVYVVLVSIADLVHYGDGANAGHRDGGGRRNGSGLRSSSGGDLGGAGHPAARYRKLVTQQTRLEEFESVMNLLGVDDWDVLFTDERTHLALDTVPRKELVRLLESDGRLAIDSIRPTMTLIPATSYNQDHEALYRACVTATRPGAAGEKYTVPFVLAYDNTSLFWVPEQMRFHPTVYVDVSGFLELKLAALRLHASQLREPLYHGSPESLELATKVRGREVGVAAAEGFVLLRGLF